MNPGALMAVVVGLVLVALGGFYFALKPHANDALLPPGPVDSVLVDVKAATGLQVPSQLSQLPQGVGPPAQLMSVPERLTKSRITVLVFGS